MLIEMLPRLVSVVRDDEADPPMNLKDRKLPVIIDDMRTFIANLDDPYAVADFCDVGDIPPAPMSLKQFTAKLAQLRESDELDQAFTLPAHEFNSYLAQFVPCVGCRRCVEKLHTDIGQLNYGALFPLAMVPSPMMADLDTYDVDEFDLTVHPSIRNDTKRLHRFLIANHGKCRAVLDSITKSRKGAASSRRCNLHNLDAHSCKSGYCSSWQELFSVMSPECREECGVVEADGLYDMLETYLTKHRFCPECKNKLTRAYQCLTGGVDVTKERGFNAKLFAGLRYCKDGDHLHVRACVNYMDSLIERAQVELAGNTRERHAKTLEIGQIEVLTCLGLYLHGRLHRLNTAVRTVQHSYQLLYCSAVCAMVAHFQSFMESRDGIVNLDSLCAELQVSIANPNDNNNNQSNKSAKAKRRKKKNKQKAATSSGVRIEEVKSAPVEPCNHTKRIPHKSVPFPAPPSPRKPNPMKAMQTLANSINGLKIHACDAGRKKPHTHQPPAWTQITWQEVSDDESLTTTKSLSQFGSSPDCSPPRQTNAKHDLDSSGDPASPPYPAAYIDPVTNQLVSPLYPHRRIKRAVRRYSSNPVSATSTPALTSNTTTTCASNTTTPTPPSSARSTSDTSSTTSVRPSCATSHARRRDLTGSPTSSPSDLGYESSRDASPNNAHTKVSSDTCTKALSDIIEKSELTTTTNNKIDADEELKMDDGQPNVEEADVEDESNTDSASEDGSLSLSSSEHSVCGHSTDSPAHSDYHDQQITPPSEPVISPAAIEWWRANHSAVLAERKELRRRVWQKFHDMQARLQAAAE